MFGRKKNLLKQYIKNILGFTPVDLTLYEQSLAHRSVAGVIVNGMRKNNERLEYLGDAVLSAIIADYLYKKYPYADEGFLTNLRSKLVSRNHLNKLSHKIGLDVHLKTNTNNLSFSQSINGDAFEAFIGAIYLDKGYRFTRKVIINRILKFYVDIDVLEKEDTNYKGKILNWSQKNKKKIEYKVIRELAEHHRQKQYVVHAFIDGKFVAEGCDFTIKAAEQQASMYACETLKI
ncbi:MAG: ribonuclease III [Bacteroidales bacterium]|nr:ribonuclease III [Bacteroidales bacterium]